MIQHRAEFAGDAFGNETDDGGKWFNNWAECCAVNPGASAERLTSMRGKLKMAGQDDAFLLKLATTATSLAMSAEPEKIP